MVCALSHVRLFVTPWTVACQSPLSMESSRQEYWSGLPFLLQGIISTQGLNLHLLVSCIGRQILYHWVMWEALLIYCGDHSLSLSLSLYIYIYICTHTHIHTHTYIHVSVCCVPKINTMLYMYQLYLYKEVT